MAETEPGHSHVGASSAYRWMKCPGSVRLCKSIPSTSSQYALEGATAHELAEKCFKAGKDAAEFIGVKTSTRGMTILEIDEGMAESVQVYLDAIRNDVQPDDVIEIEKKFSLDQFHPGMFGTNDCSIYRESEKLLIVYDYKHGAGMPVEVVDNPQLKYYALGAATSVKNRTLSEVELVIIQPRCDHPNGPIRRWRINALDLLDWSGDLIDAAVETEKDDAPLVPGSHCRFCSAAPVCPAMAKLAVETAQMDFYDNPHEPTPKPPAKMTPDELAGVLDVADTIEGWLRSVREYAHREAEAGRPPTGFKLVARQSRRAWTDPESVQDALTDLGVPWNEILVPADVRSPAQIEAVMRKYKMDVKLLAPFVVSKSSGTNLVPNSNPKPAVIASAMEDFKDR